MAIPLPALSVQTPQQPDILQQFGRLEQLRAMQNQIANQPIQRQILEQQQQSGALGVEQQQRMMASNQALMAAFADSGGDYNKAYQTAADSGKVLPQDLIKLRLSGLQVQKAATDALSSQGNLAVQQGDLMAGAAQAVKHAPEEQKQQIYSEQLQKLGQAGVNVSNLPQQYPGDAQFPLMFAHVMSYKQALDNAVKTGTLQARIQHNKAQEDLARATQQNTQAYREGELELRRGMMGLQQQRIDLQKAQLGESPNGEPTQLAQSIANGQVVPERLSYILTRNPGLINSVMQIDPSFDSSKAQAYPQAYKDFTSGPTSKQINAGAIAMQHLAQLKAINDAHPAEVRVPGSAANKEYNNLLDTVADELVTFYNEPKTNEVIASKKSTLGGFLNRDPAIQEQAIAMGVRLREMEQRWHNAAPSAAYEKPMPGLSPQALKAWQTLDPSFQKSDAALRGAQQPQTGSPIYASAPGKPRLMSTDGGKTWQPAQ